jgi:hypothetical protein
MQCSYYYYTTSSSSCEYQPIEWLEAYNVMRFRNVAVTPRFVSDVCLFFCGLRPTKRLSPGLSLSLSHTHTHDKHPIYDSQYDSIDDQLWRQTHKKEMEAEWQRKNARWIEGSLPQDFDFDDHLMTETITPRQREKDRRLANRDPAAYCADRCMATGNCDVFEDFFHLSPSEVMVFCTECVLSDSDDPCDIPGFLLEDDVHSGKLAP